MIFETHGHYDDTQFDEDREQLIAEFLEKDIDKVMNVGADMQSSRNSVELAAKYPHFYAAVGVHPSEVGELTEADIQFLRSFRIQIILQFYCYFGQVQRQIGIITKRPKVKCRLTMIQC